LRFWICDASALLSTRFGFAITHLRQRYRLTNTRVYSRQRSLFDGLKVIDSSRPLL
jgi:hypothetical protein